MTYWPSCTNSKYVVGHFTLLACTLSVSFSSSSMQTVSQLSAAFKVVLNATVNRICEDLIRLIKVCLVCQVF